MQHKIMKYYLFLKLASLCKMARRVAQFLNPCKLFLHGLQLHEGLHQCRNSPEFSIDSIKDRQVFTCGRRVLGTIGRSS